MTMEAGRRLGPYEIGSPLGKGSGVQCRGHMFKHNPPCAHAAGSPAKMTSDERNHAHL
jgi:hypothetical protein